ncbi:MAG: hypothetical protein H7235_10170 [Bdellovibrionaceae bacterium]|nr:hypothetical protein [Pseudobdellovibrionaceae bacterium]
MPEQIKATIKKSKLKSSFQNIKKWLHQETNFKEQIPSEFSNLPELNNQEKQIRENRIKLWSRHL